MKIVFSESLKKIPELRPTVFLEIHRKAVPFFVEEFEILDEKNAIIKLEDIDNKDDAKEYLGIGIYLPIEKINEGKAEIKLAYLLNGYKVYDQKSKYIGIVKELIETSGHFNLELEGKKRNYLIPFHENLLIGMDKKGKTIQIQIAEGLLEI
jgi:16S rRNA processing protein RimM